ncbi:uncharacterized protein loaf [Hetaerina americana]|uniref:uncharacterized protein loaf n=1 Tax=Hetaerina americana TaxID=62018 RepID=UPI003A7F333A
MSEGEGRGGRRSGRRPGTATGAGGLSAMRWLPVRPLLLFFLVLLLAGGGVRPEKNKFYHMASLCKSHFLQQLYRKIDGAVLRSQNERNLDCAITFQTHSILQRFMLRFDLLQLDCNDHLFVYDGAHAVGSYKADLSCRNTKNTVGAIYTRTNFVTLKYVTDGWGTESNGFKLIITAVKDPRSNYIHSYQREHELPEAFVNNTRAAINGQHNKYMCQATQVQVVDGESG